MKVTKTRVNWYSERFGLDDEKTCLAPYTKRTICPLPYHTKTTVPFKQSFLFIHEFPQQGVDDLTVDFEAALCNVVRRNGLLRRYKPGAFRLKRLANFFYIYMMIPYWVMANPKRVIITVTMPPLVHIWLALWCTASRRKLVVWLMDYHPEIEARLLDRYLITAQISGVLRCIDRMAITKHSLIIALDKAMAELLASNHPKSKIVTHPTWQVRTEEPIDCKTVPLRNCISLLYVGNFGFSHDLSLLNKLAIVTQSDGAVMRLFVVNTSDKGKKFFQRLAESTKSPVRFLPRLSISELQTLCVDNSIVAGLVLLQDWAKGVVSPSKYATYLALGLPILYCGPRDNNADVVCRIHSGGIALDAETTHEEMFEAVRSLQCPEDHARRLAGVEDARKYFSQFNAQSLAAIIRSVI